MGRFDAFFSALFICDIPFMLLQLCICCTAILNRAIPLCHEHIHTDIVSGGFQHEVSTQDTHQARPRAIVSLYLGHFG